MASGFGGGAGGVLGFSPAVSSWNFGGYLGPGGSLGAFIQEAQLDDFLYSWGGPQKLRPIAITASRELPGSTHWDPAPVPVGTKNGGAPSEPGVVYEERVGLPDLGVLGAFFPDFENEEQPPIIFSPAPILLPGQTDPGREEREVEADKENEVALTFGNIFQGGIDLLNTYGQMTSGQLASSFVGTPTGAAAAPPPVEAINTMYTGSCPPRKTRTLTIDCATGQEVKRKRRRRRALLTQGDMGVLFQIASLPNNANVRVALAGAIRR